MTSYIMSNKKKLGIKKSDIAFLEKSVEDRKLEYFKSELLKILDKKEKEESGEEVSKAFIVQDLYKSMTDPLYMAKGGKVGVVGEIRTWNGKKYKKMPNKKWVRVYDDNNDKSAKTSIARLKGKVRNAQSVEELFQIVLNNTHRFSDENGKPLAIVEELKKEVENKRNNLAINKELKKPYSKADAVKTIKEWATQDNYDKAKGKTREEIFFNFGQKLKVIGKIPEKYLKILKPSSGDTRVFCGKGYFIDHMVNHHASVPVEDYEIIPDVLENPDKVKIDDSKDVPTLIFQKKTDKYGTVVVNCKTKGDKVIFYKTGFTGNKESYKNKPPVVDRNPTINPSSVGGNGNVSALPDGNSNIAQDYNDVNKKDKESERAEAVKKHIEDKLNEYMNDSYTKSSAYGFVKKYGKARLEKIADGKIKSDEEYKKWLNDRIADIEKERGENVSDYTIDTAIWKHCVAFYEREAAREKLKSMDANEKTPDLPVDEKDMQEAKNIIGADVKRILDGRDTYGNAKQTLTDKIKRRIRNNPGVARAMLVYIKQEQEKTGKKVYTEKHSIWEELPKLNENAKEALKNGESETKTGVSGNLYEGDDGTTVVENKDWGRYQISFPGKPDSETISMLKHNGFRWSPKTQTWVCFNTSNGEYSLKRVAEKLGLKKTGDVQKSFTSRINELKKSFFDSIGA